jgi:hypothetical protein
LPMALTTQRQKENDMSDFFNKHPKLANAFAGAVYAATLLAGAGGVAGGVELSTQKT